MLENRPSRDGKLGPHPSSSVLLLADKNTQVLNSLAGLLLLRGNRFVGKVKRTINVLHDCWVCCPIITTSGIPARGAILFTEANK